MPALAAKQTLLSQIELHEHEPVPECSRQVVIRLDVLESELAIECLGFALRRPCVEQHLAIADGLGLADDPASEKLAYAPPVKLGIDEHALHLACVAAEIAKGDAPGNPAVLFR